jgi:transposase InsO family protein
MLEVYGCNAMIGKVEKVVSHDEGELWHRRLGHLHHGALKIMHQISTGLPRGTLAQLEQCKGCTLGKYVKSTFHEKENRASMILEKIHTDVCGPFSVASTTKHRYYVIFVDDVSHKCWIFFMQKKDQTFSKFCEFKALVEKESGKQLKALRSDNGGEYISNEFKDFCSREGIQRELIAPHNPQKNGVMERKNRTIVGVARAMLHDQGLPLHLQDCCPHRVLGMSTPEEYFTGNKPNVSHFKIFGSSVYVHVTKDARKKLEPTAKVGIFVGYTETPHNYHVYFSNSKMTVR